MVSSSKFMMAFVAISAIAVTAKASLFLDNTVDLIDGVITPQDFIFEQIWAFLAPILAGPIKVWITFLWENYTLTYDVNGDSATVDFGSILPAIGIGSFDQLYILLMEMFPKIVRGFIPGLTAATYTTLEDDLMAQLGLDSLL